MSCGLFSSFDPSIELSSGSTMSIKWMLGLELMLLCSWRVFILPTGWEASLKSLIKFFTLVITQTINKTSLKKSVSLLMNSVFLLFIFSNLVGLIPGNFTLSAHLSVNLSMSLTLWMSGVLVGVVSSFESFLAHFLPTGSPIGLWPLLVMVEFVSFIIRSITLSIRLMANIMAGHLLMSMIGGLCTKLMFYLVPFFLLIEGGFLMFEVCVALVQAYVFSNLLTLYWSES